MKLELCLLFSILYFVILPISCYESSCTIWVDSTHGSNDNPGTLNLPKKTISGALNSRTNQTNLCSVVLQLSPGLYLQDPVQVIDMELEIMRCILCPPFEFNQQNVEIETAQETVLITTSNATLTIRDIEFVSAKPIVKSIILVSYSNMTLLNVSMSNLISYTSLVQSNSLGHILASHSRFENNTIKTSIDHLASIFYAGLFLDVEFVSVSCQFNTLIWSSTYSLGGVCLISSSNFLMSNSVISHNTVQVEPGVIPAYVRGAISLHAKRGSIVISDSIFEFNTLPVHDPQDARFFWPSAGAAIFFNVGTPSITVSNVTFNSNSAFFGGAVAVISTNAFQGLNVLQNSQFVNNSANIGSAILVQRPGDYWKISGTTFRDNSCRWQHLLGQFPGTSQLRFGTVSFQLGTPMALVDFSASVFERNTVESIESSSSQPVAAIAIYIDAELVISDCQFNHHVTESSYPLITYDWSGRGAILQRSTFYNNSALLMTFLPGTQPIGSGSTPLVLLRPFSAPVTPRRASLLILNNQFYLGPLQTGQTTPPITISLQTDEVVLHENSFQELPVATSEPIHPNIPLISITQAPKLVDIASQDLPPMSRYSEVYISQIPTIRLSNSIWSIPLQIRTALDVSLLNVTFSSIFGQAVRLTNIAKVHILDSTFEKNVALDSGAALKITNSIVDILQSKFVDNRASRRGAIETDSKLVIEGSSFVNNSVLLLGGAIWASDRLEISASNFEFNSASSGAAIYSAAGATLLNSVSFCNNQVSASGGAIWARDTLQAIQCTFGENRATIGGAIGMGKGAALRTYNCEFKNNKAVEESNDDFAFISSRTSNRRESVRSADPQSCSGGSIWLSSAKYVEISGSTFTAGWACYGPYLFLSGLPEQLLVSDSSFQSSYGSLTGAISVFPVGYRVLNVSSTISNCKFSDLGSESGAAVYLEPCSAKESLPVPLLVQMEKCSFEHITGSVVQIRGPMGQYLNWTSSQLEDVHSKTGSVLYFDVSKIGTTQNVELPAGCIDCEMTQVSEPRLAASSGQPTFSCQSHWNISTQFIRIGLTGLYGPVKSPHEFRADVSFTTSHPDILQIFSTENLNQIILPVMTPVRLSLNVSALIYRDPIFLGPSKQREAEENAKNQPLFGNYSISLWATRTSQDPEFRSNFTKEVILTGCGPGSGLQAHPSLENTFVCQPCIFGTYNVVPSGSCYLCNDAKTSIQKATCFGSKIMSTKGFFISTEGNLLWTYECNYKYCDGSSEDQQCSEHRQGFMCAGCVAGKMESLMFSVCGSCPDSKGDSYFSHSFIAIGLILILLLTGGAHWAINKNFPVSLTALLTVQQLLIYPRQYISTVLPHGLPTALLHWACISPASALNRASLFAPLMASLLPIFSVIAILALVMVGTCLKWVYLLITRKESTSDASQDEEDLLAAAKRSFSISLRKLLLTSWVFGLLTIVPTLQSTIEFFACENDPFLGSVWLVAPSVSCNDPRFSHRRNLMLGLGTPWLVLMLGVSIPIIFKEWLGLKLQIRHFSAPRYTFRVWVLTMMATNLLVGVLTSSSYWASDIASVGVPLSMMLPAALLVLMRPMANLFLGSFLMNISFIAALIGLLPISRMSNDGVLNEAFQLYLAIILLVVSTIPLFLTERFLQRLAAYCK